MIEVNMYDVWFVKDVLAGSKAPLPYNGEQVTLFWSGGVDSTYMLFWLLAHGYSVTTVYCAVDNNKAKVKRETWARNKIKNYIEANLPSLADKWKHIKEPTSIISVPSGGFRSCLAQAPIWLVNTQFLGWGNSIPSTYVMAYVNGDDALHWIPAMNKVVEGYNMLNRSGLEPIEILFPLVSIKKSWFYPALEPVKKFLTWCEYPVLKINCECPACVRHRHELGGL